MRTIYQTPGAIRGRAMQAAFVLASWYTAAIVETLLGSNEAEIVHWRTTEEVDWRTLESVHWRTTEEVRS